MFPLGTVLAPHMVLPLHVFEPRYRTMLDDVLAGDGRFGVVLISRGHEVGGGDLRTDVGTVARILRAERLDDERWFVIAVGTSRLRVEGWLPDDPYPRAEVALLDDDHDERADDALTEVLPRLRRVLALQSELGLGDIPATFEVAEDPSTACWQAVVLAPLTPFDAQRVLAVDRCSERLELLDELLTDVEETLRFQLEVDT
ncbi:MAG: LON peptidase substrate-binding domain-containing protein [Nitriliruptoraceae bacterium]